MKKTNLSFIKPLAFAIATVGLMAGCGSDDSNSSSSAAISTVVDSEDNQLAFDATAYTTVNISLDGVTMAVRQYRIVYVANPIEMASQSAFGSTMLLDDPYIYQTMIVSVAEASVSDENTALYFKVNNAGWFTSAVATDITEGAEFVSTSDTDAVGAALKAGYVFIDVGTRSRGARAVDGSWAGKAPAPVVDAKAAIRYLRLNDALMPGSAERIVVTGTSGGGGLTAAVSASGNSADYLPFLAAVGAAGVTGEDDSLASTINDDVFAAVAYCPINNLGNADAGYEWQYNGIRSDDNTGSLNGVAYSAGVQPAASAAIAALFPDYLNSLNLTLDDSSALTDATMSSAIVEQLKEELERQLAAGTDVPDYGEDFSVTLRGTTYAIANDWLTLSGSGTSATVADIDFEKFLKFVTTPIALKTVVAFDAVGVTGNPNISGETNLFGSDSYEYANFTQWSWNNNEVLGDGSGTDDTGLAWSDYLASTSELATQLKLINPIAYLNTDADSAPYWYVRHGMIDRDTAYAMQLTLYYAIKNDKSVRDVSFKMPYLTPHSGNYDVQEAFSWIKTKLDAGI
tara:strand:- start:450 stop:2162 length:1713 start_codon:yes stop_codon:yes gene_type:complete